MKGKSRIIYLCAAFFALTVIGGLYASPALAWDTWPAATNNDPDFTGAWGISKNHLRKIKERPTNIVFIEKNMVTYEKQGSPYLIEGVALAGENNNQVRGLKVAEIALSDNGDDLIKILINDFIQRNMKNT